MYSGTLLYYLRQILSKNVALFPSTVFATASTSETFEDYGGSSRFRRGIGRSVQVLSCGFNDRTSCCSRETREEQGRRHLFSRCERTSRIVAFIHTIRYASAYIRLYRYTYVYNIHMYTRAYKWPIRRSSLLANRPRDRRVSSKQFMLPGAHRVRRALSGRARSALIRQRMVSHRMAREYKGERRDVSACRSASLSCRRQTRLL